MQHLWVTPFMAIVSILAAQPLFADDTASDATAMQPAGAVLVSEFLYDKAPFPECHASTIAQTKSGLVAAFFGGTKERNPDVCIYVCRHDGKSWSAPVEVANGVQETGPRLPTWNPALFQVPNGPLLLFYKIGPAPATWWGMMMTSDDDGATWSQPTRLPDGILGPIKDKPILLSDGTTLLCPSSTEGSGGWRAHMEFTSDCGKTWTKTDALNDPKQSRLIQPTVLDYGNGRLQALCRSGVSKPKGEPTTEELEDPKRRIYELWSSDNGKTWDTPRTTSLPNPDSGIDAVRLRDGRSLVVYNNSPVNRSPVDVAISSDDGKTWKHVLKVEEGESQYSYPAVIQTSDGLVHITYTWRRLKIRHVVVDPSKLQ
jgi:predicted neuraminidase